MQRVPGVAVAAAAAAAMLLVASFQATSKSELLSLRPVGQLGGAQLYDIDPDEAGPLIYADMQAQSNGELKDYLADAKAKRKQERMRMIERAKRKQAAHDARMYKTCEDNPSLPGCPYTPPYAPDLSGVDPEEAGSLVYAMFNKESADNLKMMQEDMRKRFLDLKFQQDVVRYEKELAGAERMVQACNMNPSLPGCPFYPKVEKPSLPFDKTTMGPLIYAFEAQDSQDKLHDDYLENKALMDRIHAQERAEMEKHIQDGMERAEISCQMNPSLPGCPY